MIRSRALARTTNHTALRRPALSWARSRGRCGRSAQSPIAANSTRLGNKRGAKGGAPRDNSAKKAVARSAQVCNIV